MNRFTIPRAALRGFTAPLCPGLICFWPSCDEGQTWSKAVYQVNTTGEYACSVVLEGEILEEDTIITVHDGAGVGDRGRLSVLRWKAPSREQVENHGFFTPRPVPLGRMMGERR